MSKPRPSAQQALLELAGDGTAPFTPAPVRALLQAAKHSPEDDTPRLVLADWLEDHGDLPRAEFLRLQCRLGSAATPLDADEKQALERRRQALLERHGGAWLGPLWRWLPTPLYWHRGLLAARFPRRFRPAPLLEMAPWLDTVQVEVRGRLTLERAVVVVAQLELNHLCLDLRMPLGEDTLLDHLAQFPESACWRSLTFSWPLGLLRHPRGCAVPAVSEGFLEQLLRCPLGRHLLYLGSDFAFSAQQCAVVRAGGVVPLHAVRPFWVVGLTPACLCRNGTGLPLPEQGKT
jgi:uncharacterized protein (TIGR02996 family)